MAGHFITKIKAKKLVLTHFSQRYKGSVSDNTGVKSDDCESVGKLLKQAEKIFTAGSVIAAEDLMVIQLSLK